MSHTKWVRLTESELRDLVDHLEADNKALLDALKDAEGYVNGRSRQSEQVRKNIRAAIAQAEHSEPQ